MRLRNATSALATRMRVREQMTPGVAVAAMDYPMFLRIDKSERSYFSLRGRKILPGRRQKESMRFRRQS
jgi:hypothetical protein